MNNGDLPARLGSLIASHTATWVEESQPVRWHPEAWRRYWHEKGLPGSNVLDELEAEYSSQRTIRREFILDACQDRPAIELFIATMAWGSGQDNRGPAKAGGILSEPDASAKIEDTVIVVRKDGAADAYRAYFARKSRSISISKECERGWRWARKPWHLAGARFRSARGSGTASISTAAVT